MSREVELKKYMEETDSDGCDYIGEVAKEKAFIRGFDISCEKSVEYLKNNLHVVQNRDDYLFVECISCTNVEEFIDNFIKTVQGDGSK